MISLVTRLGATALLASVRCQALCLQAPRSNPAMRRSAAGAMTPTRVGRNKRPWQPGRVA
jgi:hypothetical protein